MLKWVILPASAGLLASSALWLWWRRRESNCQAQAFPHFALAAYPLLQHAQHEAVSLEHSYLGTEHLLLALLQSEEGATAPLAQLLGVDHERVRKAILGILEQAHRPLALTPRAKRVLQRAGQVAAEYGHEHIQPDHLLLALLLDKDNLGTGVLFQLGIEMQPLLKQLWKRVAQDTHENP